MGTARHSVRVRENGQVTIPAEVRRRLGLKPGDAVTVELLDGGVLLRPNGGKAVSDRRPEEVADHAADAWDVPREKLRELLFREPTPEELGRHRRAVEETLALRARIPSIAPLTTADLVHMARWEAGLE